MKHTIVYLLILCMLFTVLPVGVSAAEETVRETIPEEIIREPGQCGDDLYWSYEDGVLTISGTGAMDDYKEGAPWALWREEIRTVLFSGAVTKIGAGAFADFDSLERVEFGGAIQEIGTKAFKSCDSLTSIVLPKGFRRFGEESFMSCRNLTQIHCNGGMPSFNLNCLWDTYATIYYPVDNPWPLVHIEQLESAFQGRIEFLAEDGTDPYVPTEVTQPVQTEPEETTEETVPETTVPVMAPEEQTSPTEESTQTTEPAQVTMAETEAPTEEETGWTEPSATEQKTPEKDSHVSGVWMGLCLITGTLSLVMIGALIFRRRRW